MDLDFDEALKQAAPGQALKVDGILDAIGQGPQRKKVERALRDPSIGNGRVAKALSMIGHEVSEAAVRTWRQRRL